jgi:hypothetical protein
MMPFLESVREVWSRLGYLQREQNDRPPRRPDGLARNVGFRRPALGHHDSGARVRRVRSALFDSQDKACWMLAERLSDINLDMVLGALISACEEVAVVWGDSVLLGAGMGAQVGLWILGFLGLKSLIEDLGTHGGTRSAAALRRGFPHSLGQAGRRGHVPTERRR